MNGTNSVKTVADNQNRQLAEADGLCPVCQDVFGRGVTVIPCCRNKIHRDCLQQLFQYTPPETRKTCPLCREDLPELAELLSSEPGEEAQQNLPDSCNESADSSSSPAASGHFFSAATQRAERATNRERPLSTLPPQELQQPTARGVGTIGVRELSNQLLLAIDNDAWDEAELLYLTIQNAGARLSDRAQMVLSRMLIEAVDDEMWEKADNLQRIIQGTGTRLMHEVDRQLSFKLIAFLNRGSLNDAERLRDIIRGAGVRLTFGAEMALSNQLVEELRCGLWNNAERVQRIIQDTGASHSQGARRALNNMLASERRNNFHSNAERLQRIIEGRVP